MSRARPLAVPLAAACALGVPAAPASAAPPDSWTATGGLTAARLVGVAAPLPGDRALVAGGESTASTVLKSAEVYSAATNTWSSAADMGAARPVATATRLDSCRAL